MGKHSSKKREPAKAPPEPLEDNQKLVCGLETFPGSQPDCAIDQQQVVKPQVNEIDKHDDEDAVIPSGWRCLRPGCVAKYSGLESKTEECVFHSNLPTFHEGNKV